MKIAAIECYILRLPTARSFVSALARYDYFDDVVVDLKTEGGLQGMGYTTFVGGDASRACKAYAEGELSSALLGEEVTATERIWERMYQPNKARLRKGVGMYALSALDIAVWDALGKALGQPLYKLLGGYRDEVPAYGSGGWHGMSIGEILEEVEGFREKGIDAYKMKVGTGDLRRDLERVRAVREAFGEGLALMLDANQRWNARDALEAAKKFELFEVAWLEEPVLADCPGDLAVVAAQSPVPIAAGENEYTCWGFRELLERRAAHILQPDVQRVGGVTEWMKVAHMAQAWRIPLSPHLGHELHAQLVAAVPNGLSVEYLSGLPQDVFEEGPELSDGSFHLSDRPGIGLKIREGAKKKYGLSP